jgi:hypothetical protein
MSLPNMPPPGGVYRHHPTFTCSHYNVASGNTLRTPYLEDISCWECHGAIMEGHVEGVLLGNAPEFYYLSKTQQKKAKKKRAEQNRYRQEAEDRKKQLAAAGRLCPRCEAEIVKRTNSATGQQFWGCSNYPRCKYTKPI